MKYILQQHRPCRQNNIFNNAPSSVLWLFRLKHLEQWRNEEAVENEVEEKEWALSALIPLDLFVYITLSLSPSFCLSPSRSHFHSFVLLCLSRKHPQGCNHYTQRTNIRIHITIKLSCCFGAEKGTPTALTHATVDDSRAPWHSPHSRQGNYTAQTPFNTIQSKTL